MNSKMHYNLLNRKIAKLSIWGLSKWGLGGLCLLSTCFLGCEEEKTQVRPQRSVARAVPTNTSAIPNAVDLSKYQQIGNGPSKAPDWIASQDISLMRRYSINEPTGFRNGVEFTPKGIWIERREAGWVLVLNEENLAYPTELISRGQRVEILLKGEPSSQLQNQSNSEESQAQWRIPSSPMPGKTKEWESKSEYSLELLQWQVKPYNKSKGVFQAAGKASGRLMIQFVDNQGVQGWLVGKFEDVLVRYMGDPAQWS